MAAEEELIFTVPRGKLDDLMEGLRHVEKTGSKLPQGYAVRPEHPLPESYKKIALVSGYRPNNNSWLQPSPSTVESAGIVSA